MTGARASSREQNPAYRACTYGDAAFRSIPFFVSPAQAAKAADEKTGGGEDRGELRKERGGAGKPRQQTDRRRRNDRKPTGKLRRRGKLAATNSGQAAGRLRADSAGTAGKPAGRLHTNGGKTGGQAAHERRKAGRDTLSASLSLRQAPCPGAGGRLAFFLTLPPQWRTCANISGKAAATNGGYWA